MSQQYIRQVNLVVSKAGGAGIDLSNMRIVFKTFAPDADAPPTAYIRVYNLSSQTSLQIKKEFTQVSLQAGYVGGDVAMIFNGTIIQTKSGAEDAVTTYLDIMASELDLFYNQTVVNKTLAAGSTKADHVNAIITAAKDQGVSPGHIPDSLGTGGTLPRGKVMFGMGRDQMQTTADSAGMSWSMQNGQISLIPVTGYLPGEALLINSSTGMVGVPEATNAGIEVTVLLNPKVKVGTRVSINNEDITQTSINQQGLFPNYGSINLPANTNDNGDYKVLVFEHGGDTRGNEYYTKLTCLSVDSTSSANNSVAVAG